MTGIRGRLVFATVWTGLAAVIWVGWSWAFAGDLAGGNTTARVVHVYTPQAYTIRFTTADGTVCETPHKWAARREPIAVGDTFEVHYSRFSPCENVERGDDQLGRYGGFALATVLLTAGILNLRSARRRFRAAGPVR